jgi:hypothetical protein
MVADGSSVQGEGGRELQTALIVLGDTDWSFHVV